VPLADTAALVELARAAMLTDEDYVLEAHAYYLRHAVTGHEFILAPSAHVRDGEPADGATLQIMHGTVWKGNVYIDDRNCAQFGMTTQQYVVVRDAMADLVRALRPCDGNAGLVKGGVDFAVARVGGRFGDQVLVGAQDFNLSSYGAEYMRIFLDEARATLGGLGVEPDQVCVATKVISPTGEATLPRLKAVTDVVGSRSVATTIAAVPGRWGLIGIGCDDAVTATERVFALEDQLWKEGLTGAPLR
jgi:hypothetical protein